MGMEITDEVSGNTTTIVSPTPAGAYLSINYRF